MALIDHIQNAVHKFIPQKKEEYPKPLNTASGGIGHGMQFDDEMPLSKPAIVYHACQLFFTFIAICCFGGVASFQAKWKVGPSGLTGFALFVGVTSFFLSLFMLLVPVIYDKYDRLIRLARALQEVRVSFILATTGLVWSLLISFITTISAFTQPGCKNPDNDPHASLGDTFKTQLAGWCSTKKAGAIFFWLAFMSWVATFVVAVLEWRSGKERGRRRNTGREEGFVPPVVDDSESVFTQDQYRRPNDDDEDDDDHEAHRSPFADQRSPFADQPPQLPPPSFAVDPQPRVSMDAYGAFNDPVPTGYGGSDPTSPGGGPGRHASPIAASSDPYAQIRANLGGSPGFGSPAPAPAPVPAPAPAPAPSTVYTSAPPLYTSTPPTAYGSDPGYGGTGAATFGQAGGFAAPAQPPAQPGQYQYPTYQ